VSGKDEVIAGLLARNAELEVRLARLERAASRNSGNSSMPPSTDDRPGSKPPGSRPRRADGTRRPGKQSGAPGAYLARDLVPGQMVPHFPSGRCGCGADLADAAGLGVRYSHQVRDLPEVRAQTVQHDRHEVACGCGRVYVADAPPGTPGAPGTVSYGPGLQAWAVFLMVMHRIPAGRCADILESMTGTRPPDGWVHSLLDPVTHRSTPVTRDLNAYVLAM
jgi:hypothetical protein